MDSSDDRWYWDHQTGKTYRPIETDGKTVMTVWYEREMAGP